MAEKLKIIPLGGLNDTHPMNFAVLQLMLAIPVLYCGRNFFINGFQALFHGNPNMDSLVAIGSACSFVYSVVMMFLITDDVHGHVHNLYYESSAVVLTLVSLGKFMESRNMKKTKSAITALMRLTPDTALLADSGKEHSRLDVGHRPQRRCGRGNAVSLFRHQG